MTWLSEHLSSHGCITITITITPNNIFGAPTGWESAHKTGIAKLKSEHSRSASPLFNKLDLTAFPWGGGGALLAAADLGSQAKVAVPMAPYLGFNNPNYSAITAKVLIQAGANDTVANPATVARYYQALPTGISRALTTFRDASHLDCITTGKTTRQAPLKTLVTSWLKGYLDGNSDAVTYLDGAEHGRHPAEDWFTRFEYVR
jgi:pimeloyl-ACP methyl ester carboxylesterase